MSSSENRKSMDDVLASIRRIVRAEKDPESAREPAGTAEAARPAQRQEPAFTEPEVPLALTPDMRMDEDGDPEEAGSPPPPAAAAPDREELTRMIREVLREELEGGGAEDMVRDIIRDELTTGEIGDNISQNVLRLIRDEVAKALEDR